MNPFQLRKIIRADEMICPGQTFIVKFDNHALSKYYLHVIKVKDPCSSEGLVFFKCNDNSELRKAPSWFFAKRCLRVKDEKVIEVKIKNDKKR